VAQDYTDLDIYNIAHELAVRVHGLSLSLPKLEAYEEASQIRSSAKPVCANIVEGFCRRRYKSEFIRFLTFAWSSCEETLEHLRLLRDTGSLEVSVCAPMQAFYRSLSARVFSFIRAVEREHKESR